MGWDKKRILSRESVQNRERHLRYPNPSPPLMRFFGSIGFTAAGLGAFYLGQRLLNVNPDFWYMTDWDAKTVMLVIASVLTAIIGGFLGAGIGISIEIKSEQVNHKLSVLWHYLANGTIIWLFLFMLCMNKIYGTEKLKLFVDEVGKWNFTVYTFSIAMVGCLLIGAILLMTGFLKEQSKTKMLPCLMLSLPITLTMGYLQFSLLSIDSKLWVFMGIVLSFALHPVCAYMINRDKVQRLQILDK